MKKPRRKQRGRKPSRLDTPLQNGLAAEAPIPPPRLEEEPVIPTEPVDVELPLESDFEPVELESGAVEQRLPDGDVIIDLAPEQSPIESTDHYENLAELLPDIELGRIAEELLQGIQEDDNSRQQWLTDRQKGIELLGLKLEEPKAIAGTSGTVSSVRHPLLLEAVLRFQANARGELLPSNGPVKISDDGADTAETAAQARDLEELFNHYLTTTATEYYPDTDRLLFWTGFGGTMFKKVYTCPLRRRPVSESVDAKDLIASNTITDLRNAGRITHRIDMRRSTMKRMQLLGVYRNIDLQDPAPEPDQVTRKIAETQGTQPTPQRPEDQDYELYECYCELDLPGFEHRENGEITGLPLPYRVTIDKHSRQILEIRRNWSEDDTIDYKAKIPFVAYTFVPGLGFYGIGLLHILGNADAALTAAWREMLDAGMFANFPGFLYAKSSNRQNSNEFRIAPGTGMAVETGGNDIRGAVMPLPYKEPGAAFMQFVSHIAETGQRLGGTAQIDVGEGKQDAPVGTTLALIEQATKIMSAVHKRLHQAQSEEFQLLMEEFKADPEALWRHKPKAAKERISQYWNIDRVLQALENCTLAPKADPNTPSHMHRMMKAQAVKMLAMGNQMYNQQEVDRFVLEEMGVGDPDRFFAPPQPPMQPPVDPVKMMDAQRKMQETQIKAADTQKKYEDKEKDRKLKRDIAVLSLAERLAANPQSDQIVDRQLGQMSPMLSVKPRVPSVRPIVPRAPPIRTGPLPGLGGSPI